MERDTNFGSDYHNEFVNNDIQTLSDIYKQISTGFNDEFDLEEEFSMLYDNLDKCFDIQFKQIESNILISDTAFFNNKFVEYVKFCINNNQYNKINYIFIVFCDYFDLNYCVVYNILHPKLKDNIKKYYINMIGKSEFNRQKNKYEVKKDYHQPTLFDLIV